MTNKCNHPECNDGVMYGSVGFGITSIYKCPYCVTYKQENNWSKSATAIKLKSFINKRRD